ncbi:MAG TPA: hypothetical protein VMS64_27815 [Candidatus Methylomirabilis sp.]|nr:hypothetical protein [Candidatus Methylomirabilis sp.]
MRQSWALVAMLLVLAGPSVVLAENVTIVTLDASLLRPEFKVERTRTGQARLVGYLYNHNELRNAANVLLRVEQVSPAGSVINSYQSRIVGDVLSRGRMPFTVQMAEAEGATYRIVVETVDWVMECR